MATVMHAKRQRTPKADWPLYAGLFFTAAFVTSLLPGAPVLLRWMGVCALPLGLALAAGRRRQRERNRAAAAIRERLARLPDDFLVLHDLSIRAPWGQVHLDHVVLSRFGVVVAHSGPNPGWMPERVEAVRSFLFAKGLMRPGFPIQALVLLPPGSTPTARIPACSAPVVSVERLSLADLAPGPDTAFTPEQVRTMAQSLLQVQRAS